jgi:hypothetical protein
LDKREIPPEDPMNTREIVAAAGFHRADEARFKISFGLQIFHRPPLLSSCGLSPNYYGTKTLLSSLCLF